MVEHLFRHEAARIVGILTRVFGPEHLGLAEDVVQETLVRALRTWPFHGIPENPPGWIMRAARNLALDVVRRQKLFREKEGEIIRRLDDTARQGEGRETSGDRLGDDTLRLMFVCCHPEIPEDDQSALALKVLCGFGVAEIARAFLVSEAAVAKRLTRARQRIREAGIRFEVPEGADLAERVEGVLRTLYLLFNEGHKATEGDRLVREELCHEAIRLASLLAAHPAGNDARVHALLALMLLNAARFPARLDDHGNLLTLAAQDRSRWDRARMAQGFFHLARSAQGGVMSTYHLQAGIAMCHAVAPSEEATDWGQVLALYDRLVAIDPSPVVALNRAVAVGRVEGPEAGLRALRQVAETGLLDSYYLLHAVQGDFEERLGRREAALASYRRALGLAGPESERRFLRERCRRCEGMGDGEPELKCGAPGEAA